MGLFNFFKRKKQIQFKGGDISVSPEMKKIFEENPIFQMIGEEIKSNPQATDKDEITEGYGEFGLEPTNPVPVCGVMFNKVYLNKLTHLTKGSITYNRLGSFQSPNIAKAIDNYEIFDSSGNKICNIFISPYHHTISKKAPIGFTLR